MVDMRVLCAAVGLWAAFYAIVAAAGGAGFDSHAYWLTRAGIDYAQSPGQRDAYLYAPAFAHAIRPLTVLPWHVFAVLWCGAATTTYVWLTRRATTRVRVVLLALSLGDIVYGNVWWLFAITLSLGLRRPALWAIPLLLKVTPAVGVIWFAARREWRNLSIVLTVTIAAAGVSFAVGADAWFAWFAFLRHQSHAGAIEEARLLAALGLTVYAARTDRPRLLPAALWLAAPVFSINGLAVAAALPHLVDSPRRRARSCHPTAPDALAVTANA